jgi:hypothetical protein
MFAESSAAETPFPDTSAITNRVRSPESGITSK